MLPHLRIGLYLALLISSAAAASEATVKQAMQKKYPGVAVESVAKTLTGETPPDLCEALVFTAPHREEMPGTRPNIWPEQPQALRGLVADYTREMVALTDRLARMSALALDLPETFFANAYRDPALVLRFVNYPDQVTPPLPGQNNWSRRSKKNTNSCAAWNLILRRQPGLEVGSSKERATPSFIDRAHPFPPGRGKGSCAGTTPTRTNRPSSTTARPSRFTPRRTNS